MRVLRGVFGLFERKYGQISNLEIMQNITEIRTLSRLEIVRTNSNASSLSNEHQILHRNFVRYGANAKEWMRKCVLLLPEIEKHRIWEKKGFGSIYEYAAKLAGMSRNTVDDALRILRKIEDKPELRKVVEEKGIGAVRSVVAIATPKTAEFWAEKAMLMSKHTLETYVRDLRAGRGADFRPGTGNTTCASQAPVPQKTVVMQLDPKIVEQLEKLKGQGDWNELMQEFLEMRAAQLEEQKTRSGENSKATYSCKN